MHHMHVALNKQHLWKFLNLNKYCTHVSKYSFFVYSNMFEGALWDAHNDLELSKIMTICDGRFRNLCESFITNQ